MNKKIAIILFFLGLLAVEFWSISVVYEMAYKEGRRDGIDQMVTTIDSIFSRQTKTRINGMEE
jgi:hypothetical protein